MSLKAFCPLSPNIHIQILQTDLHTFLLRISWENLIKHQGIFSFVIIFYSLTTLSLDNVWTLLGENCCWSLLGFKGLKIGHFRRLASSLCFKSLSAKSLIYENDFSFSFNLNKTDFSKKSFVLRSRVLKVRSFWTFKWPILSEL